MGCRQTKLDNQQESIKNIKQRVHKKVPIIRLEDNFLYLKRKSETCQKCQRLDDELKKLFESCSTSCPSSDSTIIERSKEEQDPKQQTLWQKKQSLMKQESSRQSEQIQSASSIFQEPQVKNNEEQPKSQAKQQLSQPKKIVKRNLVAIKKAIKNQHRCVSDATIFLIQRGALKKL